MKFSYLFLFCVVFSVCFGELSITSVIDSWEVSGEVNYLALEKAAPPAETKEFSQRTNNAIGGERDIQLVIEEGNYGTVESVAIHQNSLVLATGQNMFGKLVIQYDGVDGAQSLNNNGLNGIDLTKDGGDRFRLHTRCDVGGTIIINVYSGNSKSTGSVEIKPMSESKDYFIPFSKFVGNANFASVGALELVIPYYENLDIIIEDFDILVSDNPNSAFEFVRPIENEYINYETGCVEKIENDEYSQNSFTHSNSRSYSTFDYDIDSSSSSSSILLPSLAILLFAIFV